MIDFQQMVEHIEDSALINLDLEGTIRSWNVGAERILGYRCNEAAGQNISMIYSDEARRAGAPERELETVLRDGEIVYDAWRQRSDGALFVARVRRVLLLDENGAATGIFCRIQDVTQIRHAEEHSEERLQALVEGVEDCAIFMLDTTGKVRSWNAGARKIKQYTDREIVGQPFTVFYTAEDRRDHIPERLLARAAREGVVQEEGWRLRKDGSKFWAHVRLTAQRESDGTLVGFSKVTRELTQQRATEDARSRSEKLLEGIVRISDAAIICIDKDQRITLFRGGAEEIFGYSAAEIEGQNLDILIPKHLAGAHHRHVENFRASGDALRPMHDRRPIEAVRRNGTTFPAEASISQFQVGGEWVMTVRLRDITERKLAEELLKRSEARFASIVQLSEDAIIAVDDSNTITLFNRGAENIFRYEWQEVLGRKIDLLLPGRFSDLLTKQSVHLRGPGVVSITQDQLAILGRRSDGTEFPAEISIGQFEVAGEHVFTIRLRDITERVRHEQEIRRSLEEKEVLLKEIHHRVKNNLQVVSSLLSLEAESSRVAGARELFLESQNRVASMALIHEKLYQSGNFANIDFGDYIRSLAPMLLDSYAINPDRISLTIDVNVKLDIHKAVPCGLIVNELLSNTLKYAFPDGRAGCILLTLYETNGRRVLHFSDDGVGMPQDFEFRKSQSLGLQLVHSLASQIRGTIRQTAGPGTGFEIDFPVSKAKEDMRTTAMEA